MRIRTLSIAIALFGAIGIGTAGHAACAPQTLTVAQVSRQCMQPHPDPGQNCTALYRLIRANFTAHELGMVATWNATHPQYLYDRVAALHDRYIAVLQQYVTAQSVDTAKVAPHPISAAKVAAK